MTDPETPIKVDPSISLAMIFTGGRQILLIVGGAISLYGFIRSHDISGFGGWLGSELFTILGAASTIAVFLYGQWRAFWAKRDAVKIADAAPNGTAIVQTSWLTRKLYGFARALGLRKN
ncbi:MAG: hypothetical protein H0X34_07225 [Chthoniobacterales bacterium]|nr:hypothetical protein [Chthoniobacterales bacterium]